MSVWSGGSKRGGVDPGSKIRLEPFRGPGSAPAKPLGSLGSLSGPRVAAGLAVGPHSPQHPFLRPTARPQDDPRSPNATPLLKPVLRDLVVDGRPALVAGQDERPAPRHCPGGLVVRSERGGPPRDRPPPRRGGVHTRPPPGWGP